MEKSVSELSFGLVLWQILLLLALIGIVFLLYKIIVRLFKRPNKD